MGSERGGFEVTANFNASNASPSEFNGVAEGRKVIKRRKRGNLEISIVVFLKCNELLLRESEMKLVDGQVIVYLLNVINKGFQ